MELGNLKAETRSKSGTRDAWAMRREGWIPAIIYGHGEKPESIRIRCEEITQLIHHGHHMIAIELGGKESHGLLKEIQYDTFGDRIIHVDFARVFLDEVVTTSVPLHTQGTPKGLSAGGILDVLHHEIPLRGKAVVLPEHVDLEIGELRVGDMRRVSDLALPEGVECTLPAEDPIVIVHVPRGEMATDEGEEEATEPEVIGEKKDEKPKEEGG